MVEETKQTDKFNPKGLNVLVVDDDPLCLAALDRMLRQCHYNVTTCDRVSQAISRVMESNERRFDIVMSDVYLPYGDSFRLLDVVGLDIPVILMSASGETSVIMKAIRHGACDYLIKPLRMEVLRNLWQHVVRRKASGRSHGAPHLALIDDEVNGESDDGKAVNSPESRSKKRKQVAHDISCHHNKDPEVIDDISDLKRSRVHWTVQLHEIFVRAVNQLGIDKAVPKRILDIMKVQGLTRENVASHLQKYRLYLKRLSGSIPEPHPIASFQAAEDGKSGGTMQICPFRRLKNVPSSSSCLKGPSPSLKFGSTGIDAATVKSVQQYRTYRQNLVANRSTRILGTGTAIIPSNVDVPKPTGTLYRMSWLNLDPSRNAGQGTGDDQDTLSTSPLDDLPNQSFEDVVNIQDLVADPFGLADDEEEEDDINRVKGISWIGKTHEEDFSDNFVEEFGVSNVQVHFMATPAVVHSLEHDPVDHSSEHAHVFGDSLPQAQPR